MCPRAPQIAGRTDNLYSLPLESRLRSVGFASLARAGCMASAACEVCTPYEICSTYEKFRKTSVRCADLVRSAGGAGPVLSAACRSRDLQMQKRIGAATSGTDPVAIKTP